MASINIFHTLSVRSPPVWLIKTTTLAVALFGIFVLSGQIATWVFSWTGCLWTSSAIFGVTMLGAGAMLGIVSMWDVFQNLIH
jgi:hypothetical protein